MPQTTRRKARRRNYGRKANAQTKRIWRAIRRIGYKETKHLDTNANSAFGFVGTGGTMYELSQIAQGDSEINRDGLQLRHNSVKLDLQMNVEGSGGATYNKFRVILFRWNDDTAPTAANFFATGYTTYIQTPYAWIQDPKFKIIYDSKALATTADRPAIFLRRWIKLYGLAKYTSVSGTSGISGRIFCFIASDSAVVPHPQITGYIRYTFKDV